MKILIITLLISSCSLLSSKNMTPSPHLVTSGEDIQSLSSTEMRDQLIKTETMGGGIYSIEAMPLTKPYLEKKWKEVAETKALTSKQYQNGIQKNITQYILNKTCVQFNYSVTRFEDNKNLKNWKIAIELKEELFPLEWINPNDQQNTFVSEQLTATHADKRWHNSAIACVPVSLDLWRGFSLKVKTAFVPWPFSEETSIDWIFEALTKEDEAAVEELKKKKYQIN